MSVRKNVNTVQSSDNIYAAVPDERWAKAVIPSGIIGIILKSGKAYHLFSQKQIFRSEKKTGFEPTRGHQHVRCPSYMQN
jgi:hypothetical protein